MYKYLLYFTELPVIRIYFYSSPESNRLAGFGTRTCISRTGVHSSVKLGCYSLQYFDNGPFFFHAWTTAPGGVIPTNTIFVTNTTGAYTCTNTNLCGSSQATIEVIGKEIRIHYNPRS